MASLHLPGCSKGTALIQSNPYLKLNKALMVTRAIARYIRISTRKTGNVLDLVRGLPVLKAENILDAVNKRPAVYIKRLLRSALDSADKKLKLTPADLYISMVKADQGPALKRYRAASMGRATMIKHRTTHITLELDRIKKAEVKVAKEVTSRSRPSTGSGLRPSTGSGPSPSTGSGPSPSTGSGDKDKKTRVKTSSRRKTIKET